ncbi:MAG: YgjV family protein [Alphaproteobacteria bacterium]|nr:YgjV family protein [Alphaproteobacteria bacterium]
MSVFIIAQTIGLAGYLLYCASPHFSSRQYILGLEISAYLIFCLQWALLGHETLLISNGVGVIATAIALTGFSSSLRRRLIYTLYPLCGALMLFYAQDAILDCFAALGTFFVLTAKLDDDVMRLRVYAALAGFCFLSSSLMVLCFVPALFNSVFLAGHLRKITLTRQTPVLSSALSH